jgi:hypothetical protein
MRELLRFCRLLSVPPRGLPKAGRLQAIGAILLETPVIWRRKCYNAWR